MSEPNSVVVTGIGVVSSFGSTVDDFWRGVRNGVSAIREWQPESVDDFPVRYAATVASTDIKPHVLFREDPVGYLERRGVFGLSAAISAIIDAECGKCDSIGVSVCSGVPGITDRELGMMTGKDIEEAVQNLFQKRHTLSEHSGILCGNDSMATAIARRIKADGPVLNINGACAGATQAIGLAFHAIRRGEIDRMVAGGADSVLNIRTMTGLYLLDATSISNKHGALLCRPFDKGRSGLVAAEGGAMLLLESASIARKRGARIYGELIGYGSSLDAYKVTAPHPEGRGAVLSMTQALADANLPPEKIDYINAHGTATQLNDLVETKAIKALFPQARSRGFTVSSTKSSIGHWIAASGAPEAIATVLAIYKGEIPPTINLHTPDPQCDLDYVPNQFKAQAIDYAMSNSFGFGGINASLVFGRCR